MFSYVHLYQSEINSEKKHLKLKVVYKTHIISACYFERHFTLKCQSLNQNIKNIHMVWIFYAGFIYLIYIVIDYLDINSAFSISLQDKLLGINHLFDTDDMCKTNKLKANNSINSLECSNPA